MRLGESAQRLCLIAAAILVSLVSLEIAVRSSQTATRRAGLPRPPPKHRPLHILVDSPQLYALNPQHPEISSQGVRDDEVPIPKPEGTLRILVLGDSVTYGANVSREKTFPNRLESLLRERSGSAEVINAGVTAYTAYNELQYYLNRGREFEPDIVIVAFCLNDVVNPRLHWEYTRDRIVDIPDQAIPNREDDRNRVLPRMRNPDYQGPRNFRDRPTSALEYSELYRFLRGRGARLFRSRTEDFPDLARKIPTHVTAEDTLSIQVLLDEASPEWRWLTSIYDRLHDAVRADRARLVVALLPLAYQMDEGYPFLPQEKIAGYCRQRSIPCIDLLPALRRHPKGSVYMLGRSGYDDIWHFTELGHELCAKELLRFLNDEGLLASENEGSAGRATGRSRSPGRSQPEDL